MGRVSSTDFPVWGMSSTIQEREPAPVGLGSVRLGRPGGGVLKVGGWQRRSGAEGGAGAGGQLSLGALRLAFTGHLAEW